jgi:hypothetical protein
MALDSSPALFLFDGKTRQQHQVSLGIAIIQNTSTQIYRIWQCCVAKYP